jgi:hypothetical protein
LQKTITWTKKIGKGQHEWKESSIVAGLLTKMLRTLVKTVENNIIRGEIAHSKTRDHTSM